MNTSSLCSREVAGIPAEASIREAATLLCEEHVGSLVVMAGDDPPKVVGIVTDRDQGQPGRARRVLVDNAGRLATAREME